MWRWKRAGQSSEARTPNAPEWIWNTSDSAIAAGLLAFSVAV